MKREKTGRDLFDQQLIKVHNGYIGPAIKEAIERANAALKPPPSVVLHAIFAAAFNACEAAPDERKATLSSRKQRLRSSTCTPCHPVCTAIHSRIFGRNVIPPLSHSAPGADAGAGEFAPTAAMAAASPHKKVFKARR